MERHEAIRIVKKHTMAPHEYFDRFTTDELIYWAIKIRDGIYEARKWKNEQKG